MNSYSLDTSAIFDGQRRFYPPDVFPTLWNVWVEKLISDGRLLAPEEVLHELSKVDDDLHGWVKSRSQILVPPDAEIQAHVKALVNKYEVYGNPKVTRNQADPWVIALAQTRKLVVVTGERERPTYEKATRIPEICRAEGIPCVDFVGLLRLEKLSI